MARILYLDDEETFVLLMTRMLQVLGHHAVGHTQAAAAVAAFREDPDGFDLVITDLAMPGVSGFEFAQKIRAIRPDAAVAAASGYVDPRDIETAKAQGLLTIVGKPHTIEEMTRTIDRLLEQAGAVNSGDR